MSLSSKKCHFLQPVSQQNGDGTAAFDAIATQEPDPRADNTPLAMSTDDGMLSCSYVFLTTSLSTPSLQLGE